ncbi:hypothetical protein N8463_02780 [Synechococcus sp. AH-601-P06]|nr:hypothetical protein [Synechococcus sp. AH-601-P06]
MIAVLWLYCSRLLGNALSLQATKAGKAGFSLTCHLSDQCGLYARKVNYVTARLDGLGARLLSDAQFAHPTVLAHASSTTAP